MTDTLTCRTCGREVRIVSLGGSILMLGHVGRRTPGDRHYAAISASRPASSPSIPVAVSGRTRVSEDDRRGDDDTLGARKRRAADPARRGRDSSAAT